MKRFIIRLMCFSGLLGIIALVALLLPSLEGNRETFHYAIYDKHHLLSEEGDRTRLILLGGSNLIFGVYSPDLENAFDVRVINTAMHAGYGLKYQIDDYKSYAREGDIVVMAPEYSNFLGKGFYGNLPLVQGLNVYPGNLSLLGPEQIRTVAINFPKHCIKKIASYLLSKAIGDQGVGAYNREAFNLYGDGIKHWELERENVGATDIVSGKAYNPVAVEYIEAFAEFLNNNGGSFYFSYPCLNRSSLNLNQAIIELIEEELKETDLQILGSPSRYSFADSLHFDTHYHLIRDAQLLRTEYLIEDLISHGSMKQLEMNRNAQ